MGLLPTVKSKPKTDFTQYTTLIYGAPKVGKSTLASQFDSPLFLATESGLNAIEAFEIPIDSWEKFLAVCKELTTEKHQHKTVVIDTVDNLFKFCSAYVCKKNGIVHESELEWGKGWKLVKDDFFRVLTALSHLPVGLVLISHADSTEIKARTGNINRWEPSMPKPAWEIIRPITDFIFFATTDGKERVLQCRQDDRWDAGVRFKTWPDTLPMTYEAIKTAFDSAIKDEKAVK